MPNQNAPIFIGYRRQDSQGFAGRVADDLIDCYGLTQVFRDDDIPEGSDFTLVLEQALKKCSVLIAVIGPNWLSKTDGISCLHDPEDWVRREIEVALERGVWVQPVLVGNATMPSTDDLPDSLAAFARVQAVNMSDRTWERDLERLVVLLNQRIPPLALITRSRRKVKSMPSLREILQKHTEVAPRKQTENRSVAGRVFQRLGALLLRAVWFSGLMLLGWYVFDNHTSPEFRVHVFEFMAFAQSKITMLINRFSPG